MEQTKCPTCGASAKAYWHKLTPGLVRALLVMARKVREKNLNVVNKNELQLDHSQYGNFQKLRFHGLIAKHIVNGEWHRGEWLITSRGGQFLRAQISVPAKVKTFRNRVVEHSKELTWIKEVMKQDETWQTEFESELVSLNIKE